jgi:hypothetical protein
MKSRFLAGMLGLAALTGGCTTLPEEPPPPPAPPAPVPAPPRIEEPVVPEPPPEPVVRILIPPAPVIAEPAPALKAMQYFAQLKQRPLREQKLEQERLRKSFAGSRSDHDRMRLALALSMPGSSLKEESQALELLEPLASDPKNEYQELASLLSALLGEQRRRGEQALQLQSKLEGIKALEKEMHERANVREGKTR